MGSGHRSAGGDPLPATHVCFKNSGVMELPQTWGHRFSAKGFHNPLVNLIQPPDGVSAVVQPQSSSPDNAALPSASPRHEGAAPPEREDNTSHQYGLRLHLPLSLFAHVWRGEGLKQISERVAGGQVPISSESGEDRRGGGGAGLEMDDGVTEKRRRRGGLRFTEAKGMEEQSRPGLERLKESLPAVKLRELMDQVPWGRPSAPELFPNKKKLSSVQDFFQYAELEGALLSPRTDFARQAIETGPKGDQRELGLKSDDMQS